jgi:DUF4097 and DUF4098 domain-containing protein YvlB
MALALTLPGGATAAAQDAGVRIQNRIEQRIAIRALHGAYGFEQNRDFRAEQTDRQTKTLALGAAGNLNLQNIAGDITVKTGGSRDVTVEVVRVSRGRTEADAKLGLERVTAEVTSRGERGTVTARYPTERRPPFSVTVAYNVTAPAGTRVTVETISGNIRVSGLQGELNISAVSGGVDLASCARVTEVHTISGDLTLSDVQSPGRLEVGAVSATINLARIKAQHLDVSIVSGPISARDVQADGAKIGTVSGNIEFSGSVSPKGRYEFSAHGGSVKLGLTGGFDLEARTFSGRVEADPSLGLTPGTNTRSLRGTVGGGGGAVTATTFSGSIWVGRKLL